jgi:hypothetical protein
MADVLPLATASIEFAGIKVVQVSERYQKDIKKIQGLFRCNKCVYQETSERNAAFIIAYGRLGLSGNREHAQ